jgi:hypothetical protein
MEATILQFPVSKEEQIAKNHARCAYESISPGANITIDFSDFFDGIPKPRLSIEAAIHDAVIYHCFKTLDTTASPDVVADVFRISLKQLLGIIWRHRQKIESKGFYYRSFTRKLSENSGIATPSVIVDLWVPEKTMPTEEYIELVATAVFHELFEKTYIGKEDICGKSRQEELMRCRTVVVNILLVTTKNASLKLIGNCVNIDHSTVIFHRNKHSNYIYESKKQSVRPKVIEYLELYNHIALRIQKKLKSQ